MTDQQITAACRKYGAKVVSDAAYAAMNGRRATLDRMGLDGLRGLGQLHAATVITYSLMPDEDQAADLTEAAISGAKL